MSKLLGVLELPNGGGLAVTAYVGPNKRPRLQLTLEQGEGGITAHGNTDPDGAAELVGWLETWLLELGRGPAELPHIWTRSDVKVRLEKMRTLLAPIEEHARKVDAGRAPSVDHIALTEALAILEGALELVQRGPALPRAAIDGPALARVHDELHGETASDELEASIREMERDGYVRQAPPRATPASDRLERQDVVTELEDFGKIGEERDEAFARSLAKRRAEYTGSVDVATIAGALRAQMGRAIELEEYLERYEARKLAPLEFGPLVSHAAQLIDAHLELGDILEALARQDRG